MRDYFDRYEVNSYLLMTLSVNFIFILILVSALCHAVWSMQFIEIAYVSSIREISIVFAAIIGMIFLFEKNAKSRIIPSILIVSGISVVYFQIL